MSDNIVAQIDLDELTQDSTSKSALIERDINLIGHVQVTLRVEIGTAKMSVAELFALKNGDVINLIEKVNSPVTLYVNNKAVAQGNLVAVDDNFGVQVTHII